MFAPVMEAMPIETLKEDLDRIKAEEKKAREELSKEVEAKEDVNIAEGKLEIDDPINIEKDPAEESENDSEEKDNLNLDIQRRLNIKGLTFVPFSNE